MKKILSLLLLSASAWGTTIWTGAGTITVPAALSLAAINPTAPLVTGTSRTVCASACTGTTVQAVWNLSTCGDEIVITAGQTFSGTLILSNKACVGWITIRSSSSGSLPAYGSRVGSANATNMPKLQVTTNNTDLISNDYSNVTVSARVAHNVYFLGIEMSLGAAVTTNYGLVVLSSGGDAAGAPSNIVFDRCWIHTDHLAGTTENFVRGMEIGGNAISVIGSTIEGFASNAMSVGADSQAINIFDGPGPFLVSNNYLDAASEILMVGGTSSGALNNQSSDITISFNHFKKQIAFATAGYVAKNCLELKIGVRVFIHDNLIENCYNTADQVGSGIVIWATPGQSGLQNTTTDVIVQGNIFRHMGQGFQFAGPDQTCGAFSDTVNTSGTTVTITSGPLFNTSYLSRATITIAGTQYALTSISSSTVGTVGTSAGTQTGAYMFNPYLCAHDQRVVLENDLFDDISNSYNGGVGVSQGEFLQIDGATIDHVTLVPGSTPPGIAFYTGIGGALAPGYTANLAITNSIAISANGFDADGFGTALQLFLIPPYTSGYMLLKANLMAGIDSTQQTNWNVVGSGNQFPANQAAIGLTTDHKALDPTSTYYGTGIGANVNCLDETAVTNGTPPSTSCVH